MVSPLFLAFFLLFHLHISAQEFINPKSASCPESFQCQSVGLLKFPFTNMLQPGCGLIPINCDFQPPKIKLSVTSEQWFDVQSIEPGNLIELFDPVLQDHFREQSCESFNHEIKIFNSNSISFTVLSNIMRVFKCSNQMNLSQEATDYFNNHGFRKYESCEGLTVYYGNSNGSFDSENPSSCPVTYFPMKSTDAISENTDLFQLLTADFQIEWHASNECQDCCVRGGQCETDLNNQFLCIDAKIKKCERQQRKLRIIIEVGATAGVAVLIVFIYVIYSRREKEDEKKIPSGNKEDKNKNVFVYFPAFPVPKYF